MDYFLHHPGYNTFFNLALEEYLMMDMPLDSRILLIWQSDNAVVLGKHQNPWLECDMSYVREHNIDLARRISGGGAVYHDKGNINFAFIIPKTEHNPQYFSSLIQSALKKLGLNVDQNKRHDLLIKGKKISGNAFSLKKDRALHHGTLLVDSDLEMMKSLKVVNSVDLKVGVRSVPSQVTNIKDHKKDITVSSVINSIREEWGAQSSHLQDLDINILDQSKIKDKQTYLQSWDWIFGNTPPFSIELSMHSHSLKISVEHAYVQNIEKKKEHTILYNGNKEYKFNKKNLESLLDKRVINPPGLLQRFVF